MLTPKTTAALIAAISVIATASAVPALTSQAFAQNNNVTAFQSNSVTKDVDQSIRQDGSAYSGDNGDNGGDTSVNQFASQGFCEQINQQNAAAGNNAANFASNSISESNCS
jgi:endonuclease I